MREPGHGVRRPAIWLGDYLDAISRLAIDDSDQRGAVAELLGFERAVRDLAGEPAPMSERVRAREQHGGVSDDAPPQAEPGSLPQSRAVVDAPGSAIVIAPGRRLVPRPSPKWLDHPLPRRDRSASTRPELIPLIPQAWARAILSALAAVWRPEGEIDVGALVTEFARRTVVARLPRRRTQSLRFGARLIIDNRGALEPFSRDVELLIGQARRVLGREISVHYVRRDPRLFRLPAAGTPVVIASDLGATRFQPDDPEDEIEIPISDAWHALVRALMRTRCPVAIITPFPPYRWPAWTARSAVVLPWDHRTTPAKVALRVRRDPLRR